jgi:hypothetical protein
MKPLERISVLLRKELRKTRPNSRVVADYARAIRDVCSAQSETGREVYYCPKDIEEG